MPRKVIKLGTLLLAGALMFTGCSESYDIVITGGTLYDGTGSKGFQADIGITDNKIAAIGTIDPAQGRMVIDAQGKYVSPGFIDMHTHSDRQITDERGKFAQNYLTQGVTTMVTGNCGGGTYKVAEFYAKMEEQGIGTNIVHLIGHGTVRRAIMQMADRAPTPDELEKMKALVEEGMSGGAGGMSTGLFYSPGSYSETEEVIELAKVVQKYGGFYATHLRDESNYTIGLIESVKEAIEIGEKANIQVEFSHLKALGKPVWGQSEEVCRLIEEAKARGLTIYADQYPYNASSTSLVAATMPRWVQADGKLKERLKDRKLLPGIKKEIAANIERRGGPETLVTSSFPQKREWEGKSLLEISRILRKNPVDTAIELALMNGPGVVSFNMSDEDIEYFMQKPYVATGSDGSILKFGKGVPHPRNYGTFPRKIRLYCLDKKVLSMEQVIRAGTGLPAEVLGFKDRGLLKEGYVADIVVFNPATISDKATFTEPHQYCEGIDYVLVNGTIAIDGGAYQETLAGKPLRNR